MYKKRNAFSRIVPASWHCENNMYDFIIGSQLYKTYKNIFHNLEYSLCTYCDLNEMFLLGKYSSIVQSGSRQFIKQL
jgi:hypothetical protein